MDTLTLSALYIYPVKSLAGISAQQWPVTATGFQYDRKWMLIDSEGYFMSQRKVPRMALIKTEITENHLILRAPGMDELFLPLQNAEGPLVDTVIWHDQCQAIHIAKEADQWLSDFLRTGGCRLVYQADTEKRAVDLHFGQASDQVAFSDGFPFLLISENSLVALNQAMGLNLPMNRFRPNLVVSGCGAFAEDNWREIQIGTLGFRLPKPCSRCAVPTINQDTGETGKEPLTTLNRLRKWQNKVYFGQNALHNQSGQLAVGDSVSIQSTGPAQPPL